jgi:hypothetical protein
MVTWLSSSTRRKLGPWRLRIFLSYNKFGNGCVTFLIYEKETWAFLFVEEVQ